MGVDSPHEIFVGRGATLVGDPHDVEEAGIVRWIPLADIPKLFSEDQLLRLRDARRIAAHPRDGAWTALNPLAELVNPATLAD